MNYGPLSVWQIRAKPGKLSLAFVDDCCGQDVIKFIHFNLVGKMAHCYDVGSLSVHEDVLADDVPW